MIITSPEQALEIILMAVGSIMAGGFLGSPISTLLTSIVKRFVDYPANGINFVVSIVLTVLYWVASHAGVAVQFQSLQDFILQAAPVLLTFVTTFFGASKVYDMAVQSEMPVLGYRRTDPLVPQTARRRDMDSPPGMD